MKNNINVNEGTIFNDKSCLRNIWFGSGSEVLFSLSLELNQSILDRKFRNQFF